MFIYPKINLVAFEIGPIKIYWYGIMYLLSFVICWRILLKVRDDSWSNAQISDLLFYIAMGIVFGGRFGYVAFYQPYSLILDPITLLKFWVGRSFHGGLIGAVVAIWLFARRNNFSFFKVADFIAPLVPIGLGFGRIGNFINGELWGRVTDVPWAMIFPFVDNFPRHPSQIYEFLLEGVLLLVIMTIYARKSPAPGKLSGLFLVGYGIIRVFVELFREPDGGIGLLFDWMTMGQILSLPMIIIGSFLLFRIPKENLCRST